MLEVTIAPNQVFDRLGAQKALGLNKTALAREIRLGRLRCAKRVGKCMFLGEWLLEWVRTGEVRKRRARRFRNDERTGELETSAANGRNSEAVASAADKDN